MKHEGVVTMPVVACAFCYTDIIKAVLFICAHVRSVRAAHLRQRQLPMRKDFISEYLPSRTGIGKYVSYEKVEHALNLNLLPVSYRMVN